MADILNRGAPPAARLRTSLDVENSRVIEACRKSADSFWDYSAVDPAIRSKSN